MADFLNVFFGGVFMKCYNHPREEAIAQCLHCGKGLCEKCAKKWSEPICDDCERKYINAESADLNKEIIIYIVLAILGFMLPVFTAKGGLSKHFSDAIVCAVSFPMYYAGWKWLNYLTDKFSLFATINIWIIYFAFKLILSAFVGLVALPYRLFTIFKREMELKELLEYTK